MCQTATKASLQWPTTYFLVAYAGLKAFEALGCRPVDPAMGPTALQEASAQNMRMGTDVAVVMLETLFLSFSSAFWKVAPSQG